MFVRFWDFRDTIALYGLTALACACISFGIIFRNLRSRRGCSSNRTPLVSTAHVTPKMLPTPGQVVVSKILIHPIKSCKGISLAKAKYTPEGLENDRVFSILDATKGCIITAREVSKMVLITPTISEDGLMTISFPLESECATFSLPVCPSQDILDSWTALPKVTIWPTHDPVDGYICQSTDGVDASATLSKYFGKPVHLIHKGPRPRPVDSTATFPDLQATAKYQDMYPLLVLSEESIKDIEEELQRHIGTQGIAECWKDDRVVIERFRPNIVLKGGGAFAEDQWEEISIGSEGAPLITLVSKCTRCLLPNVSPATGERDAAVPYKVLMKFRIGLDPDHKFKPCVGCNGVPRGSGEVTVGDWIYLKKLV